MEKDITLLGNEYMSNTIKKLKEKERLTVDSKYREYLREELKKLKEKERLTKLDKTIELVESKYREDLREELKRLKPTDRILIGDILAICKRSDKILGRPKEDCNNEDESLYVIVSPSKESVIVGKDINNLAVSNGKFKFLSINYLIDQILEFNFTYIQIVLGAEEQVFKGYYGIIADLMREIGKKKDDNTYTKLIVSKAINTAYAVLGDIGTGKIDGTKISSRLFFIYNALNLAETYLEDKILSFCKSGTKFNSEVYTRYIKNYSQDSVGYIKSKIDNISKRVEEFPVVDKETAKLIKLQIKSKTLERLLSSVILEDLDDNK